MQWKACWELQQRTEIIKSQMEILQLKNKMRRSDVWVIRVRRQGGIQWGKSNCEAIVIKIFQNW